MSDLIDRQTAQRLFGKALAYKEQIGKLTWTTSEVKQWIADCIEQLPPAQPEQTNCDYCHEDVDGYVKPIEKNGHAFVRFGMNGWELSLKANGWNGEAKIQYCPMCGRKL